MAKDPAILFYTSDFLTGTMTMSNEEVGKYIRLLCLQHQKKRLTDKDMLYICGTYVEEVYNKFTKDANNQYFNERLEEETIKRRNYSESRRKNISKRYEPTYVLHMENENEDVNINITEEKKMETTIIKKEYFLDMLPIDSTQQFIESWNEWCDFRREIKKKLTKLSAKKQLTFLFNQPDPIKCINQSIQNGWTGLFEVTQKQAGKIMQNDYTYQELNEMSKTMSKDERIKFWDKYEIQENKKWKLK
jgi:uncharacterized protein YdaU (DUF1376 family)